MCADVRKPADFKWTQNREKAAIALAEGRTREEAADIAGISERTIYRWLDMPEFSEEVDRLSLMIDVASRAHRLRLAKRIIRQIGDHTEKDLLDWLRYAQQETEGIKLGLTDALAIEINTVDYRQGLNSVAPDEAKDWWEAAEQNNGPKNQG